MNLIVINSKDSLVIYLDLGGTVILNAKGEIVLEFGQLLKSVL